MPDTADQTLHDILALLVTFLAVAFLIALLVRYLTGTRPDLRIGAPVATALVLRVLAAVGVSLLPVASTLRGGDEVGFAARGQEIANTPLGSSEWSTALTGSLHEGIFAIQVFTLDSPDFALRITQAGIGVAALVLLAAAVYELAGRRAALLAAWLLALEPAGIFFSTLLHKEANMMLAVGLVAFGGAMMWKRVDPRYLLPIGLGCLIAVATRPYAGWFLIAAAAAITLHTGVRARRQTSVRSLMLVAIVVLLGAIAAPTVLEASTNESLTDLQVSQDANARDAEANLALERVDFSTREGIITNLPIRIRDVLARPYPWEVGNTSQRFAFFGTTFFLIALVLFLLALWRNRGAIMERAGPLLYVTFFLLIAYSLSTGNAGTAFRYRTQIVAVGICALAVLWFRRARAPEREAQAEPPHPTERWPKAVPAID